MGIGYFSIELFCFSVKLVCGRYSAIRQFQNSWSLALISTKKLLGVNFSDWLIPSYKPNSSLKLIKDYIDFEDKPFLENWGRIRLKNEWSSCVTKFCFIVLQIQRLLVVFYWCNYQCLYTNKVEIGYCRTLLPHIFQEFFIQWYRMPFLFNFNYSRTVYSPL